MQSRQYRAMDLACYLRLSADISEGKVKSYNHSIDFGPEAFIHVADKFLGNSSHLPPIRLGVKELSYRPEFWIVNKIWVVTLISVLQVFTGGSGCFIGYLMATQAHLSSRKRIVNVFVEWLCFIR